MLRTVAEALVAVLEEVGVKQVFGLIGDSLNPLGDAVRQSAIEWVGVRHEEGAALAAADQAKLTGRLAVCAGTTGPGSTHLVAGLYEAARDHAPVLALSGEMPRRLKGIDYHQSTEPDLLFRDVSLHTQTIVDPAQAPSSCIKRFRRRMQDPGVAHLTLPQDVLASRIQHADLVDDSAPAAIRTSGATSTSAPGSLRCRMTVGFPGPLPSSTARDLAANISRIGFGREAIGQLVDKYDIRGCAMHTEWKGFR